MNKRKQESISQMLVISSIVLILACTGVLIFDYLRNQHLAPIEKSLVESMEETIKTDAGISQALFAERERQTNQSIKRDSENKLSGVILGIAAAILLISANWMKSMHGESVLPMDRILALHSTFAPSTRLPVPTNTGSDESEAPLISLGLDLTFVDKTVAEEGRSTEAAIPILRAIQLHYGYLPDDALQRVCELTDITPAQIAGTSSFYSQFRTTPVGKHLVRVCHGTACHVSGIVQITEELERHLAIPDGEDTDPSRMFTLEKVACLGCCSLAPVIMIDDSTVGRLTPASACDALRSVEPEKVS